VVVLQFKAGSALFELFDCLISLLDLVGCVSDLLGNGFLGALECALVLLCAISICPQSSVFLFERFKLRASLCQVKIKLLVLLVHDQLGALGLVEFASLERVNDLSELSVLVVEGVVALLQRADYLLQVEAVLVGWILRLCNPHEVFDLVELGNELLVLLVQEFNLLLLGTDGLMRLAAVQRGLDGARGLCAGNLKALNLCVSSHQPIVQHVDLAAEFILIRVSSLQLVLQLSHALIRATQLCRPGFVLGLVMVEIPARAVESRVVGVEVF